MKRTIFPRLVPLLILALLLPTASFAEGQSPGERNTIIEKIEFLGNTVFTSEDLLKAIGIKVGSALGDDEVRRGLDALRAYYKDRGYAANIGSVSFDGGILKVTIQEIRFQEYILEGTHKTRASALRKLLRQKEGSLLTFPALGDDRRSLLDTDFFEDLQIDFLEGRSPALVRIKILLKEKEYPVATARTVDLLEPQALVKEPQFKAFGGLQFTFRELFRSRSRDYGQGEKEILARHPGEDDPDGLFERALILREAGRDDEAKRMEAQALPLFHARTQKSPSPRDRYRLAVLYEKSGQYRESAAQSRTILNDNPDFLRAYGEFLAAAGIMEMKPGYITSLEERESLRSEIREVVRLGEERYGTLDPAKASEDDLEGAFEFYLQDFLASTRGMVDAGFSTKEEAIKLFKRILMEGFCERVIAIAGSLVERNPSRTDLLVVKSAVEVFAAFQMKLYGLALEEGPGGPLFSEGTRLMAKGAGNLIKVERTHGAEYPQVYKFLAVALADAGDHNGVFEATRKGARYLAGDGQLYSGITFISFENSIFGIDARTACENLTQSAALLGEIIARHDGAAQRVLLAKMLYYLADSSVEGRQSEPAPEREKLKADAAENLEHVLKKDPGDFDALYTLGLIRLRALDARAALSCLERALAVKEEDKDLHYGLAVAYLLSGEKGKAVDQMRIFAGR